MEIFEIVDSALPRDRWYLGVPFTPKMDEIDPRLFSEGKQFSDNFEIIIPVKRGNIPLDFTLGSFEMPVLMPHLIEKLSTHLSGENQVIPATIAPLNMPVRILNVLHLDDAIDEVHSEITWKPESNVNPTTDRRYFGIGKIVLRRQSVSGVAFFRLKRWEYGIYVNSEVKSIFERNKITGVRFRPVQCI
jgi:hypothetical protein